MKNFLHVFALILIAGCAGAYAQTAKATDIKGVDFSNFTYKTGFGTAAGDPKLNTIKLANGTVNPNGSYDEGGMVFELFNQPVYGDVNGDKAEDAVVEIKGSAPSSYRVFEVQVYTFQKGAAKLLASLTVPAVVKDLHKYFPKSDLHYAGLNSPKIENGLIVVEALTDGNFACPENTTVFKYKLTAGKFVLSGKPVKTAFKCSE
jgi:hypothetical protein